MGKVAVGVIVGGALGAIDGLSAWFSPEARPILPAIVLGSTVKGVITGVLAGIIARWRQSTALGIGAGAVIGFALSSVAALGQPSHYLEIVLPGMLVGTLVGFVTQRYPDSSLLNRKVGAGLILALVAGNNLVAQDSPPRSGNDSLAHLAPLIGRWEGTSEGQPGKGRVEREYRRALGDRFFKVTNRSVYPAQAQNPKGEVHEDEGWFSYDRARKRVVFRQFHVEGFVNQYVETESPLRFVSEAIENIPAGWKARETYTLRGNELDEVFELAEPGKDFEVYSRTRLTRVP